jgi:hypothetical protein
MTNLSRDVSVGACSLGRTTLSVGDAIFPERELIPACAAGAGSKEEAAEALLVEALLEEASFAEVLSARALTAPGESDSASIADETALCTPDAPCAIAAGTPPANKMSARN